METRLCTVVNKV